VQLKLSGSVTDRTRRAEPPRTVERLDDDLNFDIVGDYGHHGERAGDKPRTSQQLRVPSSGKHAYKIGDEEFSGN
jgi:hypothetical protein